MDNAADRKSIRAKEKAARQAEVLREDVIRNIMSTAPGRQWLWDILASCHIFATTFNGDALQSAFHEGERNVGLRILATVLTTCPDQYIQAQREANERDTIAERRSSPQPDGGDTGAEPDQGPDAPDAGDTEG